MSDQVGEEQQLIELHKALKSVPADMIMFSAGLRKLYNELQVTGNDEATRKFICIRDRTRKQAVVYMLQVLPKSEDAIKAISCYMDLYKDLEFEEWSENLPDILEELKEAQGVCELLRQMYMGIVVELKLSGDEAEIGISKLEELHSNYERQKLSLMKEAKVHENSADSARFYGTLLAIPTLFISKAIGDSVARDNEREANRKIAESIAKNKNAEIAKEAAVYTRTYLIPAIQQFINGLEVCLTFIDRTKTKVEKMIRAGDMGPKRLHYKTMNKRAGEISDICEYFLSVSDTMRTNLMAIPVDPSDKNYVDKWFEQQLQQFKREKEPFYRRVMNGTILRGVPGQTPKQAIEGRRGFEQSDYLY